MQTNKNINYPVNLGTTQWSCATGGYGTLVQVETGDGFEPVVTNYTGSSSGTACTENFTLWWVGTNQFALQVADNSGGCEFTLQNLYLAFVSSSQDFSGILQGAYQSIASDAIFGLENLGGGGVAITFKGDYLNGNQNEYDWGFNWIEYSSAANKSIFNTGFPDFITLLISGSGLGLNLVGQNLAEGNYIHSISGTDFTGANLTTANLSTLPDLSVDSCTFIGATLTGAILTGVQHLNRATWTSAILAQTNFSRVDLSGVAGIDFSATEQQTPVNLSGATLSNGRPLAENFHYGAANFNRANLTGAVMDRISCVGAHFVGATLSGANLTGADLSNADLTGAVLTGATLAGTILTGATLIGTIFDHCDLSSTIFSEAPKFGTSVETRTRCRWAIVPATKLGLNWSYVDLSDATITDIPRSLAGLNADEALLPDQLDLQGVDLTSATFRKTRMYGIQLQGANLEGATMTDALLKSAWLNKANLTMADLSRAWLVVETATPKTPVNQLEAASVTDAFMFNTVLDQSHCDGVDFSRANFSTSMLSDKPASAVDAYMNDAKFNDAWVVGAICDGAQFSGANLANAHLIASTFRDSGARAAQFTPSIRAVGIDATIVDADISGTNFKGANQDALDMIGATFAEENTLFSKTFAGYNEAPILVMLKVGKTVLGDTTSRTLCPNGNPGPCSIG